MRRKGLSLLLCIAIIVTSMQGVTIIAAADSVSPKDAATGAAVAAPAENAGQESRGEPILAYVPLDNRPVNVDRVIYEAESAGFTVKMPDEDLYATRLDGQPLNSNGTPYGDSEKLLEWILQMDEETDYFVISLDQLLSGGLVNSRTIAKTSYDKEYAIIDAIVELSRSNHVYIADTVTRLASCTVGYQGADLETYNYLRQYNFMPRADIKSNYLTVKNIAMGYSWDTKGKKIAVDSKYSKEVRESLRVRERKMSLIDYILKQDSAGNMKYFIGIDDSTPQTTIQTNEIKYIRETMGDRGLIYSGTDELGMMAVLSLMIDYYGYDVNVATVYFGDTQDSSSGSAYDLETVRENVEGHLQSLNVDVVEPKEADIEIVVLTSPATTLLSTKYINQTIDYLNKNIAEGIPTILINSAPGAYSGNLEYRMIRECEMSMLLAYSSWNTVGNSIGLALGNGISRYLYLHSRDSSSDKADIAFLKGLIFSYEKDVSYQRGGGKTLFNNYLAEKGWSNSNFYQDDEQVKTVNTDLETLFKTSDYNVTVNDIIDNLTDCRYFKGLAGECGIIGSIDLTNYSAPFFRTFEIRFNIDVKLSDITLLGFKDAMNIALPYEPEEGQLVYSVNLYYLDQGGKLHKIPCIYDKESGSIRFATGDMPFFFTDTLTMEADKALSLFRDVPATAWYFNYVLYVYEKGLMNGTGSNTFSPNGTMTRAMLAQTLYKLDGEPSSDSAETVPQDVQGKWYENCAGWALSNGVAAVDERGLFGPDTPLTRGELVSMLWNYGKYAQMDMNAGNYRRLSDFADSLSVPEELKEAFDWACSNGVITGTKNGTLLSPKATATRAEVAAVLKRFMEIQ